MRLCLELLKCKSDNATEKFYWLEVLGNVGFSMKISIFLKNLKNKKKMFIICEVLLYELSERGPG